MIEPNTLHNGDCLEVMKEIQDNSIDCIICDLPYNVLNKTSEGGAWDVIIPFEPLWEHYKRIIKPNAAIILFGQGLFTAMLIMSQPKLWRYNLIWDKKLKSGFLNANRMPLRQHEDIVVFYKKLPTYNPQMIKCEPHKRCHGGSAGGNVVNRCYGNYVPTPTIISDEKFPSSIITFPKEHFNKKSYHPTEKPVNLLRYLIRTYTNENDVILDNCMGSGSTCVAAIKEKRKYIGIEKEPTYFDIAKRRTDNELSQLHLF